MRNVSTFIVSWEQVEGFGLWTLRAVMNGLGDEQVNLAKTSLVVR